MVSQRERSERTIAAILEAGRALMTEAGYAGVTVDDVTARARVAKGAFYHHFSSKRALLDAVVDRLQGEIADELRADRQPDPLTADGLAAALEGYLRRAAHPARRRLVLVDGPEVLGWERWREIDNRHFGGRFPVALQRAMDDGLIAQQPIEPLARLLLGAVTEVAIAFSGRDLQKAGTDYARAFQALLDALRLKKA